MVKPINDVASHVNPLLNAPHIALQSPLFLSPATHVTSSTIVMNLTILMQLSYIANQLIRQQQVRIIVVAALTFVFAEGCNVY